MTSTQKINLVLPLPPEPEILKKLRIYIPIVASAVSAIFITLCIVTFIFLKIRKDNFIRLQNEAQSLEMTLSENKDEEGIYIMTYRLLALIDQTINSSYKFSGILNDLTQVGTFPISLRNFTVTRNGEVSVSFISPSADSLSTVVLRFTDLEKDKKITNLQATEIYRDKDGTYHVTISGRSRPENLK